MQRPGQAVRDYGVWVCVCVGWGGGEFLRTLTPSDPAQPKKSGESDCRLQTADWQTELKASSQSDRRQRQRKARVTVEEKWRKRLTKRQTRD